MAAAAIDIALALGLAVLLAPTMGRFFAARAVVTLRIGDPSSLWSGPLPLILGTFGEIVYALPFTLLLAWLVGPITGATSGERITRLRICDTSGRPASRTAHWLRCAIETSGMSGWTLALLTGLWPIAVAASIAWAAIVAGTFATLAPRGRALHDRLSGTMVCRR